MKVIIVLILLLTNSLVLVGQETEVLTLGTFHFNFPNLDVQKVEDKDQIDVLDVKYQKEIKSIVAKLADFKPTIIAIERIPEKQIEYDSIYDAYLKGEHKLARSEDQQIGFRLAKKMGLKKLHCVDEWGAKYPNIERIVYGNDSIAKQEFMHFFYNNPDTLKSYYSINLFKDKGILADLIDANSKENLEKILGNYLIGIFKYKTEDNPYFGADFVTGWWFSRNLRIFRNIQKIQTNSEDRILVIFGSGHMNLLNILFNSSPEYELKKANKFKNNDR